MYVTCLDFTSAAHAGRAREIDHRWASVTYLHRHFYVSLSERNDSNMHIKATSAVAAGKARGDTEI
eukprot:1618528-Pleurochrysis_carterae.AAC.6